VKEIIALIVIVTGVFMPQEKMTQDEVDALINSLSAGSVEIPTDALIESPLNSDQVKYKYNNIVACKARYDHALLNESLEDIKEAAKNLHRAGFSNWLFKYGFYSDGVSRANEYYRLMNREAKKRGLREPFKLKETR